MGSNLKNAAIALLSPLPSILFYLYFLHHYHHPPPNSTTTSTLWEWCTHHPLLLANALFFLNINLLFWVIGLIQSSHWMIDLYWTVIPVMLVHYYASHPLAIYDCLRSKVVIFLTWVWSTRIAHNYFRRENWLWGSREDWRFSDMRLHYANHWWWISFFSIYLSQQVFLMGNCLPFYVIHTVEKPWQMLDSVAVVVCLSGIIIAYYADTQLHNFVSRNYKLKELGMPEVPSLETGLWFYSRHPNYFGEQLWWWGLFIFAFSLGGHGWTFIGPLINSICLAYVTKLVEDRMVKKESRADAYRLYQKTTSVWIPWFKSKSSPGAGGSKDKTV